MTANELSIAAGIVLSLAFSFIPSLNTKYAGLTAEWKRLIMLGLLLIVAAAAYGVTCLGWFDVGLTCDKAGISQLVQAFVLAVIANQSTYSITPQPKSVREVKQGRVK